jgi:CRP-like cAMP-binding protein
MEETQISLISTGQSFGELALLNDEPRTATIRCVTDCHMAFLTKQYYQKILSGLARHEIHKKADFLRSVKLFQRIPYRSILTLIYHFQSKNFTLNQIVYREGEVPDSVYCIKSGEFVLAKTLLLNEKCVEIKFATLAVGEIFGESECLLKEKRKFKVTSNSN